MKLTEKFVQEMKGNYMSSLLQSKSEGNYIRGTNFVSKHTLQRHLASKTSAFRIGIHHELDSYDFSSGNIKQWQHKYYDKKGKGTYNLLDEEYESYGLDQAIIFNSKIPHGGANFGQDIRVIGSIGFSDTYEQMIEFFKDWI